MGMNGKEEEEKKEEKEAFGREGRGRATTRMLEACSTSQGSLLVLFTCTALLRGLSAGRGRVDAVQVEIPLAHRTSSSSYTAY
jgi:hypothetical protein